MNVYCTECGNRNIYFHSLNSNNIQCKLDNVEAIKALPTDDDSRKKLQTSKTIKFTSVLAFQHFAYVGFRWVKSLYSTIATVGGGGGGE